MSGSYRKMILQRGRKRRPRKEERKSQEGRRKEKEERQVGRRKGSVKEGGKE